MYGTHVFPQVPYFRSDAGVNLGYGISLPPGGNVVYVRSTGAADLDPPELIGRTVPTLAAALSQCRAGKMDTVVVLPGHSESVSDATMLDNLVAGTRIVGVGQGDYRPTFTWTATTSQWKLDNAGVVLSNLLLKFTGATVAKAVDITAADVSILGCEVVNTIGAGSSATVGIAVSNAAHGCKIIGNHIHNGADHTAGVTDAVLVAGTTTPRDVVIRDNIIMTPVATNGPVRVSVAAKNILVANNQIYNLQTAAVAGISVGNVAADGLICGNMIGLSEGGTTGTTEATCGIVFTSTGSTIKCFENYACNDARASGLIDPAVGD